MSSEIHHLQLRFAFFLWFFFNGGWTFGESNNINLFRLVNFRNKVVSIYLAHMIFNFIPANSAKWGEMLDVNNHKTNKLFWPWKEKRQRLVFMRKKAITCLRETREWKSCVCVLDLGIQKLSIKILGCLPYPHSTR